MAANPVKGEASLDIKGLGSFTLALPFSSRGAAEEETGLPFHEIVSRAGRGFEGAILVVVWAALQKHHPEVKLEQVKGWLDDHLEAFMEAATKATDRSAPSGNAAAPKAKKSRRGTTSGRNGAKPV